MGSFWDDWLWMVTTIMAVELDSVRGYSLIVNLVKRKTKKKTKFCVRRPKTRTTWTIQEMMPVWGRRQSTLGSSLWLGLSAWRCWMLPTKEGFGILAAGTLEWLASWKVSRREVYRESVEGRFTYYWLYGMFRQMHRVWKQCFRVMSEVSWQTCLMESVVMEPLTWNQYLQIKLKYIAVKVLRLVRNHKDTFINFLGLTPVYCTPVYNFYSWPLARVPRSWSPVA